MSEPEAVIRRVGYGPLPIDRYKVTVVHRGRHYIVWATTLWGARRLARKWKRKLVRHNQLVETL